MYNTSKKKSTTASTIHLEVHSDLLHIHWYKKRGKENVVCQHYICKICYCHKRKYKVEARNDNLLRRRVLVVLKEGNEDEDVEGCNDGVLENY